MTAEREIGLCTLSTNCLILLEKRGTRDLLRNLFIDTVAGKESSACEHRKRPWSYRDSKYLGRQYFENTRKSNEQVGSEFRASPFSDKMSCDSDVT